jgi:hypothetical protein
VTSADPELDFLRQVEDLFAASRGLPHVLSPKDVQLIRSWFADSVPLAAVAAGVTEAIEKKREAEDGDVVVSLSYCRHAVRKHAKRMAAAAVGSGEPEVSRHRNHSPAVHHLCDHLGRLAGELRSSHPETAEILVDVSGRLGAAADADRDTIDGLVFALESEMLRRCRESLSDAEQRAIDEKVRQLLQRSATPESSWARVGKAHRDRLVREALRLPRLELP